LALSFRQRPAAFNIVAEPGALIAAPEMPALHHAALAPSAAVRYLV
jgi:hypothetical protein